MTAAACPLCSRIAAGLGRPTCPLCHGRAAVTLGPTANSDVMAHAVAIAIRRGVDSVLADVEDDPTLSAADALEELTIGLLEEGYLAAPDDIEAVDITGERLTLRGDADDDPMTDSERDRHARILAEAAAMGPRLHHPANVVTVTVPPAGPDLDEVTQRRRRRG